MNYFKRYKVKKIIVNKLAIFYICLTEITRLGVTSFNDMRNILSHICA